MIFHLWRPVYANLPTDDSYSREQTEAAAADVAFLKSIIITPPAVPSTSLNKKSEAT